MSIRLINSDMTYKSNMTKIAPAAIIKVTLLAILLFFTSSFVSRQKVPIPIYDNVHAGGFAHVTTNEGFPVNYIDNSNGYNGYSVILTWLLLDIVILDGFLNAQRSNIEATGLEPCDYKVCT